MHLQVSEPRLLCILSLPHQCLHPPVTCSATSHRVPIKSESTALRIQTLTGTVLFWKFCGQLQKNASNATNMLRPCLKIVLKRRIEDMLTNTQTHTLVQTLEECSRQSYLSTGSLSVHQLLCCYKQRPNTNTDTFKLEAPLKDSNIVYLFLRLCIIHTPSIGFKLIFTLFSFPLRAENKHIQSHKSCKLTLEGKIMFVARFCATGTEATGTWTALKSCWQSVVIRKESEPFSSPQLSEALIHLSRSAVGQQCVSEPEEC